MAKKTTAMAMTTTKKASSNIGITKKINQPHNDNDDDDEIPQAKETTTTTAQQGATGVATASSTSKQRSTKRRKKNEKLSSSLPISASSSSALPSSNKRRKTDIILKMQAALSPSGAVVPIEAVLAHNVCGMCWHPVFLCRCTGIEHNRDYIYAGLPPPSANSRQRELIKRWTSLIACNPVTVYFNSDRWYSDNIDRLIESMVQRKREFHEMLQDYIATLSGDVKLPALVHAVIGGSLDDINPITTQQKVDIVATEITDSYETFMCGDWACLTFIGSLLLQNAFQASNPEKYSSNDLQFLILFENGIGLIHTLLSKAYNSLGYRLAIEMDRSPCTTTIIQPASHRLRGGL